MPLKAAASRLFNRALWHVNRSSLGHVVKAGATAFHVREKIRRRNAMKSLAVSPELRVKSDTLQRDGYVELSDVMDSRLLVRLGEAGLERLRRTAELASQQTRAHKRFWVRLLDAEMQDGTLSADSVFVQFALQPSVVGIVGSAMREVPTLDYVLLTASRYSEEEMAYSQFWHRDYDDVRTIKLFAYLTEVLNDEDGPFTFLPRAASRKFGRKLLSSHFPDDQVFREVDRSSVRQVKAPRLTTFLVETSACLHMGSRMGQGHERLLYTATFTSFPRMYPSSPRPFRATPNTSAIERMVMAI